MSPDAKWIVGIGLPIIVLLIGVIWAFLRREIAHSQIGLSEFKASFEQWKKDKERFDYEFRHEEYAPAISRLQADLLPVMKQVDVIEKRIDELKDWKHEVVDPYIPRAVDEHERRINRLDAKVFNGHH